MVRYEKTDSAVWRRKIKGFSVLATEMKTESDGEGRRDGKWDAYIRIGKRVRREDCVSGAAGVSDDGDDSESGRADPERAVGGRSSGEVKVCQLL